MLMICCFLVSACSQRNGKTLFDEGSLDESLENAGFEMVGEPPQTVFVDHALGRVEKKCFEVSKSLHVLKICLQKFPNSESAIDAGSQLGMNLWTGDKKIAAFIRDTVLVAIYGNQESEQDVRLVHQTLMKIN